MPKYPNGIYTPREKENRAGVVYDPTKKTVTFAEDFKNSDAEIVAVQTELGTNPKGAFASVKDFLAHLLGFPAKLKPALVRWVIPGWYAGATTTGALLGGRVYYIPIFISETTTYTRIAIEVTTSGVGTTADLRIFRWSDGLPGSLILAAGTVDTSTIGVRELVISQVLTRGFYFLAVRSTGNISCRGLLAIETSPPFIGGFASTVPAALSSTVLAVDGLYQNPALIPTIATTSAFAVVRLREN